ncbi:MAG: GNAT family N-acetyltransferase [Clostridia bacterium]|nr:GNAT family N-acetyltransferase [Clostridia bacterium]
MEIVKYEPIYYTQVNDIYEKSFPQEEKYITLDKMIQSQGSELYCLVDNEIVLGIMYLIFYKDMIFILYLAVNTEKRSKGYGSYLLKWCLEKYGDKKIYLNIEEVKKEFKDYETRKKRLDFYLKNGFFITNYISKEELENFNILSNSLEIDINQYKILDKVVAKILDEPISNIVKR